jgi:hypothetical protein
LVAAIGKPRADTYIVVERSLAERKLRKLVILFFILLFGPLAISAGKYWFSDRTRNWQIADRTSAGLLPRPSDHPEALVRVFTARTVRWRSIFAVHSWIVVKEKNAMQYTRYDYTAWGEPIRVNGFAPDGRWFGGSPQIIAAADGIDAERMIPTIRSTVKQYKFATYGDYQVWPGPNSNTFVATVLQSVPDLKAVLPPTAIGKDYPYAGKWFDLTATGVRLSLGGYVGLTIGWIEGLEINILGAVLGVDIRRPALKLPGLGRLGFAQA